MPIHCKVARSRLNLSPNTQPTIDKFFGKDRRNRKRPYVIDSDDQNILNPSKLTCQDSLVSVCDNELDGPNDAVIERAGVRSSQREPTNLPEVVSISSNLSDTDLFADTCSSDSPEFVLSSQDQGSCVKQMSLEQRKCKQQSLQDKKGTVQPSSTSWVGVKARQLRNPRSEIASGNRKQSVSAGPSESDDRQIVSEKTRSSPSSKQSDKSKLLVGLTRADEAASHKQPTSATALHVQGSAVAVVTSTKCSPVPASPKMGTVASSKAVLVSDQSSGYKDTVERKEKDLMKQDYCRPLPKLPAQDARNSESGETTSSHLGNHKLCSDGKSLKTSKENFAVNEKADKHEQSTSKNLKKQERCSSSMGEDTEEAVKSISGSDSSRSSSTHADVCEHKRASVEKPKAQSSATRPDSASSVSSTQEEASSLSSRKSMSVRSSMKNVRFYLNELESMPKGAKIEDMLADWCGNYTKLEQHHGYIQWLFPTNEAGLNSCAQPLTPEEVKIFKKNHDIRNRVIRAYEMMLNFYGMKLVDKKLYKVERAANWRKRFDHLNGSFHNNLRITRILKFLSEIGMTEVQIPFVEFLVDEVFVHKTLTSRSSCKDYWLDTVEDKRTRDKLLKKIPPSSKR